MNLRATTKAAVGVVGWIGSVALRAPDPEGGAWALALLLFAALVLVPLALELFAEPGETGAPARLLGRATQAQLPAAFALAVSCWLAPGWLAAAFALPWAALLTMLAVVGGLRVGRDKWRRPLDGLCADAALLYGAIGGAWVLADRAGWQPLRFHPEIVTLTAVHFHYAGLLLPLLAGRVQRELFFWRTASQAAVGVVLGVPAVALGITFTQLGWGSSLETAFGCGLALAGMIVGVLHVRLAVDGRQALATRVLLGVA
ncbi:MAG: YndJ family transporter, partial [Opitutaceae bacterium]